jgi:hypothetical protein
MKHFKFKKGILACLLSLALAFSCFSTVGIKAEEAATTATAPSEVAATYDWAENVIKAGSNAYVYVLKAEKGNTIKAGTAANGQMASNKISLADLKVTKINKDAYFYVCDKEFETEGKSINANLVIKATSVKKAAGAIDYTKADVDNSTDVLSATATDTSGKKIENPVVYWSTEANGTFYAVNATTNTANRKYADGTTPAIDGFDGRTLKEMLEAGGVVYIKIAGESGGSGTAQFASKVIKVKVAKQAKAPKVKVDVKKDTFSIKNGMDFALFTKNNNEYTLVDGWKTVLPQLKDAATKELDASIVSTSNYKPVDKKNDSAKKAADDNGKVSYTSLKIKNLSYKTLVKELSAQSAETTEYYIGVRTSATSKKPASAVTYFKYAEKTEAPIVYTESCVSGQYLVASGTDFDKKGILLKDIANYNGVNGTSGYDDSFALATTAGSGADTNAASYEFAVVNQADLEIIDWSTVGWKKLDVAKTKITSKLKTGYTTVSGTTVKKVKAQLSALAKPNGFTGTTVPTEAKTLLLVRRVGVKGKTAEDSVVASNIIKLYVIKDGKNYEIYSEKSIGEVAYKYTVDFYKWSESGQSTYAWKKDDSLTVTGWGKNSNENATIAAVAGADLYEILDDANTSLSGSETSLSGGKLVVAVAAQDVTKKYAIREYANVKIVAEVSISGETTKKEETLITIKNGKSNIAEDTKTYYVGENISIPSGSGQAVSSISGYTTGDPTTVTGGVTVDNSKNYTFTVNSAEEATLKVAYKRTAITYTWNTTGENATVTPDAGCLTTDSKATYNKDVVFKVEAATGYKIDAVEFKIDDGAFQAATKVGDKYKVEGSKILGAVTVKVTTSTTGG